MTNPTKWLCAQPSTQSLCWFCHVAAQSDQSLLSGRNFRSLDTHWSVWSVFAVWKKLQVFRYALSAQQRLWSDWANAQADLSLRLAHTHFDGFVMWLISCDQQLYQCWSTYFSQFKLKMQKFCSLFFLPLSEQFKKKKKKILFSPSQILGSDSQCLSSPRTGLQNWGCIIKSRHLKSNDKVFKIVFSCIHQTGQTFLKDVAINKNLLSFIVHFYAH